MPETLAGFLSWVLNVTIDAASLRNFLECEMWCKGFMIMTVSHLCDTKGFQAGQLYISFKAPIWPVNVSDRTVMKQSQALEFLKPVEDLQVVALIVSFTIYIRLLHTIVDSHNIMQDSQPCWEGCTHPPPVFDANVKSQPIEGSNTHLKKTAEAVQSFHESVKCSRMCKDSSCGDPCFLSISTGTFVGTWSTLASNRALVSEIKKTVCCASARLTA